MAQKLSETDVFFELFLPSLCDSKALEMRQYKHQVALKVKGQAERTWTLSGGEAPYVARGLPKHPDLSIEFSPKLVEDLVLGKKTDLQSALENHDIGLVGKEQALIDLEFIFG